MIPTREQCIQMLSDYCVPVRVQQHSRLVARTAVFLAKLLNRNGYDLNLLLIEAAALLHDLAKLKNNHARAGAEILVSKGYVETAGIVRQHMKPDLKERGRLSEVTVVYLADKYAEGDRIVPLEQRFMRKKDAFYNDPVILEAVEGNYRTALKLQGIAENAIGCPGGLYELLLRECNKRIGGLPE